MTPEEIKAARLSLGLTAAQVAHIMDVDVATVQAYEAPPGSASAPKRGVNKTAARVMGWLLAGFRPPQWPQD